MLIMNGTSDASQDNTVLQHRDNSVDFYRLFITYTPRIINSDV